MKFTKKELVGIIKLCDAIKAKDADLSKSGLNRLANEIAKHFRVNAEASFDSGLSAVVVNDIYFDNKKRKEIGNFIKSKGYKIVDEEYGTFVLA